MPVATQKTDTGLTQGLLKVLHKQVRGERLCSASASPDEAAAAGTGDRRAGSPRKASLPGGTPAGFLPEQESAASVPLSSVKNPKDLFTIRLSASDM